LNLRPSGYEPDELPDCSTPHRKSRSLYLAISPMQEAEASGVRKGCPALPCPVGRLPIAGLADKAVAGCRESLPARTPVAHSR
jgi:hypothetical protein